MSSSRADVGTQIWDFSKYIELTIDRPAKEVWPYLFRPKSDVWSRTSYTTRAGEPGKAGEIFDMAYPLVNQGGRLLFEALTVVPVKRLVLKITYQKNGDTRLAGYDFFTLNEAGGRTTVIFDQASELPVDATEDPKLLTQKHEKFLDDIFQDLKKMAEGRPLGDPKNPWQS